VNKSNQHNLPESLEAVIALWEQHLNEFAILLSDAIPSLKKTDWIIEKKRVFVGQMVPRKEGEPQAGPFTILVFH
jgi:hypothetical protein